MVSELLPVGKKNAISTLELCEVLHCNIRELRKYVAEERKAGMVICSSTEGGYYKPDNRAEVEEFVSVLDKKSRSIMVALKSARKYLKATEGQIEMPETAATQ